MNLLQRYQDHKKSKELTQRNERLIEARKLLERPAFIPHCPGCYASLDNGLHFDRGELVERPKPEWFAVKYYFTCHRCYITYDTYADGRIMGRYPSTEWYEKFGRVFRERPH